MDLSKKQVLAALKAYCEQTDPATYKRVKSFVESIGEYEVRGWPVKATNTCEQIAQMARAAEEARHMAMTMNFYNRALQGKHGLVPITKQQGFQALKEYYEHTDPDTYKRLQSFLEDYYEFGLLEWDVSPTDTSERIAKYILKEWQAHHFMEYISELLRNTFQDFISAIGKALSWSRATVFSSAMLRFVKVLAILGLCFCCFCVGFMCCSLLPCVCD